jgi:AraC-like DNA-binding protein
MEWINMVTINQAKNLLRQPDTQVKDVAAQLGFPEQFTFRKYFKTHTGMSPTEYQRM